MTNESGPGATSSEEAPAPLVEKRRSARRQPAPTESLARVRSRTGRDLDVVDLSPTGLLIEGQARLLPNTHLDVHVVTRSGRVLVRCRVVRAWVWRLESDLVLYRTALTFDREVDTSPGYPVLVPFSQETTDAGMSYPSATTQQPASAPLAQSA